MAISNDMLAVQLARVEEKVDGIYKTIAREVAVAAETHDRQQTMLDEHDDILRGNGKPGLVEEVHEMRTTLDKLYSGGVWAGRTVGGAILITLVTAALAAIGIIK